MTTTITVTPGSTWTLKDQEFRNGINYQHTKDEDFLIQVHAVTHSVVSCGVVTYFRLKQPDEKKYLAEPVFFSEYRPATDREKKLAEKLQNDHVLTGDEFMGPWELEICRGCGIDLARKAGHTCIDGRYVNGERKMTVTVVRQVR
jgi:hypothetical protein